MSDFSYNLERARELIESSNEYDTFVRADEFIHYALLMNPWSAEAWLLKSRIAGGLDDLPTALAAVEMARRYGSNMAEVHYWRAMVLTDFKLYTDALESIQAAFDRIRPEDGWLIEYLFFGKAELFRLAGKPDMAMRILSQGLAHCPGSEILKEGLEPLRRERVRASLKVIPGAGIPGSGG